MLRYVSAAKGGHSGPGKMTPTHSLLTAETCMQTIRLLASQLTVYTDDLAIAGAGVTVTDPTIHWLLLFRHSAKSSIAQGERPGSTCCMRQ